MHILVRILTCPYRPCPSALKVGFPKLSVNIEPLPVNLGRHGARGSFVASSGNVTDDVIAQSLRCRTRWSGSATDDFQIGDDGLRSTFSRHPKRPPLGGWSLHLRIRLPFARAEWLPFEEFGKNCIVS